LQDELDRAPSELAIAHMRKCTEAPGNRNIPWIADKSQQRNTPNWAYRELGRAKELNDAALAAGVSVGDFIAVALEAALAGCAGVPVGFASVYHGRAITLGGRLVRPLRTCGMLEYFVPGLAERHEDKSGVERIMASRAGRETIRQTAVDMFRVFE